ncbi:MAG: hypothetical protein ACLPXB_18710 [Thiobacillaceae bacterium]
MLKTFIVDGDKGGVGKSMVARTLVDMYCHPELVGQACQLIVLDADRANPDLCGTGGLKAGGAIARTELVNLDDEGGWIKLGNLVDPFIKRPQEFRVVVNMPAGIGTRVFDGSIPLVSEVLDHINAIPVWVLNRTNDGINALEARCRSLPRQYGYGVVVTNLFHGSRDKFSVWDSSPLRQELIHEGHWVETELPEMYDLLAHNLGRMPLDKAETFGPGGIQLGFGEKLSLNVWRRAAWESLKVIESLGER